MAQQLTSGLSVAAFCARERLNAARFYQWRSRLREEATGEPAAGPAAGGAFVDLGALGGEREGKELPHVDVHRMRNGISFEKEGKRRYPLGENLIEKQP